MVTLIILGLIVLYIGAVLNEWVVTKHIHRTKRDILEGGLLSLIYVILWLIAFTIIGFFFVVGMNLLIHVLPWIYYNMP